MILDAPQRRPADLAARQRLLQDARAGKVDELSCPQCERQTVSVWFTRPAADEYHTWFLCSACGFEMRAQNSGRPAHYSETRDRTAQHAGKGQATVS